MSRHEHGPAAARSPVRRSRPPGDPASILPRPTDAARRRWPLVLPLLVLLFGIGIRLEAAGPVNETPDEELYTYCGSGLYASGLGFMPAFIQDCWDHRQEGRYPWPSRIGYFWMVAATMLVLGDTSVNAGATLSCWASVAVLCLTAWLLLRRLGPWVTAIALLFLATSPLDRAIASRTWQDEIVALFALLMVNAYVRFAERPTRPTWAVVFFAAAAAALTVKETEAIVYGLGTVAMAFVAWRSPGGVRAATLVLAGGVLAAAAAAALVLVSSGGIEPLRKCYVLWQTVRVPNAYMRQYQMGTPAYYAVGLMILNAVPFALGLAGAIAIVLLAPFMRTPWSDPRTHALLDVLTWLVLLFAGIACAYSQKNLRFLSVIFVPTYALASTFTVAALAALKPRVSLPIFRAAVAVVVIGLCESAGSDLARFHHWFVVRATPDLATPWFTR